MIYRPNSAKVKNLKTKDYLGKARLIAAADKSNVFTGFAGAEAKKILPPIITETSRDDRPPESISFAASNLVKQDLLSRSRQQSEPPINRNMFPPTPPPDGEPNRPSSTSNKTLPPGSLPTLTGRANSVKNPPPRSTTSDGPKFNRDKELPRLGTVRTASEPRGPPSRYPSTRGQRDRDHPPGRGRLFMEAIPSRREDGAEADIDEYPDELYDMYRNNSYSNPNPYHNMQRTTSSRARPRSRSRQRPRFVEDTEECFSPSNHSSLEDFEMLNDAGGSFSRPAREDSRSRGTSRSRRQPDVRNIRVKVHSGDDTRYIMVEKAVKFEDFVDRVREKLGMVNKFKVKMKDEGDLITVGDKDDWEMATQTVRTEARKEGLEMGKMEVGFYLCSLSLVATDFP